MVALKYFAEWFLVGFISYHIILALRIVIKIAEQKHIPTEHEEYTQIFYRDVSRPTYCQPHGRRVRVTINGLALCEKCLSQS